MFYWMFLLFNSAWLCLYNATKKSQASPEHRLEIQIEASGSDYSPLALVVLEGHAHCSLCKSDLCVHATETG